MDGTDRKIIEILKLNARTTSSEIAKKTHLSVPAVSERIRKLEERGIIEKFTVKLNREDIGLSLLAFISVELDHSQHISSFREEIVKSTNVLECHHLVGEYDYLLKVAVSNTKELEHFISFTLKGISGIKKSNTIIALSTLKEDI